MTVAERPSIPAERFGKRLADAQTLAAANQVDAILVGVGADMRYLSGYPAMALERLTMVVVPARGDLALVCPRLEAAPAGLSPAAARGDLPVVTWEEGGDAYTVVAELVRTALDGQVARVLVSDDLAARHLLPLQGHLQGTTFGLASSLLRELRMIKDADELELLRLASHAADRVVAAIAAGRLVGRTEADVAAEVRERLVSEGHDEATFAIVA